MEAILNSISKNLPFDVSVEYNGSTPGDQFGIYCDYSKIERSLGWKPLVRLEDGIADMCKWALDR